MDIGCGCGKSASTLIDLGYDVTGIDVSYEAIRICRRRFGDSAEFIECDVRDIDDRFDYIVAVHALEHLSDADLHIASSTIIDALSDGGYIFIRDFAPGDLRAASRENSDIDYFYRAPTEIAGFFPGLKILESGIIEERTRFGSVRRRSELLLRKA